MPKSKISINCFQIKRIVKNSTWMLFDILNFCISKAKIYWVGQKITRTYQVDEIKLSQPLYWKALKKERKKDIEHLCRIIRLRGRRIFREFELFAENYSKRLTV